MYKTILLTAAGLILSSCQSEVPPPQKKPLVFSGNVMTIDYKIMIGEKLNPEQEHQIESIVNQTFNEVNAIYNKWNPGSELSRLNRMKGRVKATISPELEQLLHLTDKIVKISDGRFDPTIEPVQQLWKNRLAENKRPTFQEIQRLKPAVGWDKIHFGDGIFYKEHDWTSIDLGGIAKGYAVDLIYERIQTAGFKNAYVEWGGEIRAGGLHPEGRPWTVAISRFGDPDPSKAIAYIALTDQAVATSGDYEQNWTIEGDDGPETYFHVIDPRSCEPKRILPDRIASASVRSTTCAMADGMATVGLMFDSLEEAGRWTDQVKQVYPDTGFWLSTRKETL